MQKYVCIHGHFYQPPRENPWLEDVELQDSAYPYHDWNARVTEECYKQNAASRILGPDRRIVDIVNNYESISFNFGPTLLYWLQLHVPEVYQKILEADRKSQEKFSGHGCAIAQAYNHMILPLSNTHDKHTQAVWGIHDFQKRFEREPEGMWLPETAVDLPTLEALAEHGIKFTILSPRQAKRVRKIGTNRWKETSENELDTTIPYICNLPSGKKIVLFFYHGHVAHELAYGGLLQSGENFATKFIESFSEGGEPAQLVSIAADGESFGHHHHHGDMALAYCLHHIETNNLAKITIYGEFLEKFPPNSEVEIWENSSWSCVHGVERWKSNCGCCANQSYRGQQQWRAPLREALDWLRDRLAACYEQRMSQYHTDPWRLRNEYISVINDRSAQNVESFILSSIGKELDEDNKVTFLKLLEMQRNAMLMYTSCGWFFDNITGIETVQVMQYAACAMQLCQEVQNANLEPEFKNMLENAPSNVRQFSNGKEVYEAYVAPARIDLERVCAHFALSSIFENYGEEEAAGRSPAQDLPKGMAKPKARLRRVYCYSANVDDAQRTEAGIQVLTSNRTTIQSKITFERYSIESVVLYLGDHNIFAAVRPPSSNEDFHQVRDKIDEAFRKSDNNEVMRLMNVSFNGRNYSLSHLFKDQQRRILNKLLTNTWEEIESSFRHIFEHNYAIMQMIRNMNMPLPKALSTPAEFILNQDICRAVQAEETDLNELCNLADEAARLSLALDREKLSFEGGRKISRLMNRLGSEAIHGTTFGGSGEDVKQLQTIERTVEILKLITPEIDLQNAQNIFFTIAKSRYAQIKAKAQSEDETAKKWISHFENLGQHLGLAVP